MIQRNSAGVGRKAEKRQQERARETWIHTKKQNPWGMKVRWKEGLLPAVRLKFGHRNERTWDPRSAPRAEVFSLTLV